MVGRRRRRPAIARGGSPVSALYLGEPDVAVLLSPLDAVAAVEEALGRIARGAVDESPPGRLRIPAGAHSFAACVDRELGYAALRSSTRTPAGGAYVVLLFEVETGGLEAVVEAGRLGSLGRGAASAAAARRLSRDRPSSLGVIGCGRRAAAQVECVRAALPTVEHVVASCPDRRRLAEFCRANACEQAESHQEAARTDVVVAATPTKDPVLRGEWLSPGALVCAAGADEASSRELDNAVIERAAFVCCDSRAQSELESGDLIEPVAQGVLDWLEVHELHEVVAGELEGRASPDDIVLYKSNGVAAWDVALGARVVAAARDRGLGREL